MKEEGGVKGKKQTSTGTNQERKGQGLGMLQLWPPDSERKQISIVIPRGP